MSGQCDLQGRGWKNTELWLAGLLESGLLENLDLYGRIIQNVYKNGFEC